MTTRKADSWRYGDKTEHDGEREKVLVPVRCNKDIQEEKLPEELDKEKVREIQRRWYIY